MQQYDQLYIDGAWVAPEGTGTIDVINASTEEVMGSIPEGTAADVDRAVAAAVAAFPAWAATSPDDRAKYVQAIAEGLAARSDEIAATICGEVGMPMFLSKRIQAGLPQIIAVELSQDRRRLRRGRRRSATPWWSRSRWASSVPSRPGTTRSTRSC